VVDSDGFDVVVFANADTHAHADGSAGSSGVGAAMSITIATNITTASIGGQIKKANDVKVLAAKDTSVGAKTPTYLTEASASAGATGGTLAMAPAVAIAIATNVTVAALLPTAQIGTGSGATAV